MNILASIQNSFELHQIFNNKVKKTNYDIILHHLKTHILEKGIHNVGSYIEEQKSSKLGYSKIEIRMMFSNKEIHLFFTLGGARPSLTKAFCIVKTYTKQTYKLTLPKVEGSEYFCELVALARAINGYRTSRDNALMCAFNEEE